MASSRKIKISDQCSRCPREQERYVTLEEAITLSKQAQVAPKPSLEILMDGVKVASYDFLCDACRSTVTNYVGSATHAMKKKSSKRVIKAKEKAPAQAPTKPPAK